MSDTYNGQLEIDRERGVIYFHCSDQKDLDKLGAVTLLRICSLPKPIPRRQLDVFHMFGTDWDKTKGEPQ